jgi:hypothetical protein
MQNENKQIARTNSKILVEYPTRINENENNIKEIRRGTLLSNRETNHPEIGRPKSELIGIAISMLPNSASFKSKKVLIVGIRDAQVEKQNPDKKK